MNGVIEQGWRIVPLDSAAGAFHPETGIRVRWDGPQTEHLRARAPRLVLFGASHACNLSCGFCSRDASRPSLWTVDEAFDLLSGLAHAGVLEVSLGGGEPLAWPGFDALVLRLAEHTPLAVHVTTNGRLLTAARLASWRGAVKQVRLSIYDGEAWPERASTLARAGQRFGANVLVTPQALHALPALLGRLADLGATDAALLRTIGADPGLHLTSADEARLEHVALTAPLPIQLSRCWADRLPGLPRLWPGDCGAGTDIVAIGPDKRLSACSFGALGPIIHTADDVIAQWSAGRAWLSQPAGRIGCARPDIAQPTVETGIRVWQGYSGNFSGDCVLVGRFASPEEARRVVDGVPRSASMHGSGERVAVGAAVVAHEYGAEDELAELRARVLAAGGRVVVDAVRGETQVDLLVAIGDASLGPDVGAALDEYGPFEMAEHGGDLLVRARQVRTSPHGLGTMRVAVRGIAAMIGAIEAITAGRVPIAGELVVDERGHDGDQLPPMLAARPGATLRVLAHRFEGAVSAEAFAAEHGMAWCAGLALSPPTRDPDRLSRQVVRAGGAPVCLEADRLVIVLQSWYGADNLIPPLLRDPAVLRLAVGDAEIEISDRTVRVTTRRPEVALDGLRDLIQSAPGRYGLSIDVVDPLAVAIRRVKAELREARGRE